MIKEGDKRRCGSVAPSVCHKTYSSEEMSPAAALLSRHKLQTSRPGNYHVERQALLLLFFSSSVLSLYCICLLFPVSFFLFHSISLFLCNGKCKDVFIHIFKYISMHWHSCFYLSKKGFSGKFPLTFHVRSLHFHFFFPMDQCFIISKNIDLVLNSQRVFLTK